MTSTSQTAPSDHLLAPDGRPMARREMLATLGLGAAAAGGIGLGSSAAGQATQGAGMSAADLGWDARANNYVLPPLPYAYNALEPHIDEQTMTLHHDRHHAGYVRGLNASLDALAEIRAGDRDAGEVKRWSRQLAFTGSGHFLHVVFWNCMSPEGGGRPSGGLGEHINRCFGSFKAFTDHFKAAAGSVEGSGWGLLVLEPLSKQLMVMQAEKHQNLTAWGVIPLVAIDVWEHAYYLKYQNRRGAYVDAFMNIVNWDGVAKSFDAHMMALQSGH